MEYRVTHADRNIMRLNGVKDLISKIKVRQCLSVSVARGINKKTLSQQSFTIKQ